MLAAEVPSSLDQLQVPCFGPHGATTVSGDHKFGKDLILKPDDDFQRSVSIQSPKYGGEGDIWGRESGCKHWRMYSVCTGTSIQGYT